MNKKKTNRCIIGFFAVICILILTLGIIRIHAEIASSQTDLYALIPHDAKAVLSVEENLLKQDDIPIPPSVISFHSFDKSLKQVFYFRSNQKGENYLQQILEKQMGNKDIFKTWHYKGRSIYIYPLKDDQFLSVYRTESAIIASRQLTLIRHVIDCSFHSDSTLANATCNPNTKKSCMHSALWVSFPRNKTYQWIGFQIHKHPNGIFLTGILNSHDNDWGKAWSRQSEIEALSVNDTTNQICLQGQLSCNDLQSIFDALHHHPYIPENEVDNSDENHVIWFDWLKQNIKEIDWLQFTPNSPYDTRTILKCQLKHDLQDTDLADIRRICSRIPSNQRMNHHSYLCYTLKDANPLNLLTPTSSYPLNVFLFKDNDIWFGTDHESIIAAIKQTQWIQTDASTDDNNIVCLFNLSNKSHPISQEFNILNEVLQQLFHGNSWVKIAKSQNDQAIQLEISLQ